MKILKYRKQRRGWAIGDQLFAIVAFGALALAGLVIFNQVQMSSQTSEISRQVIAISSQVRSYHRYVENYENIDIMALARAGVISPDLTETINVDGENIPIVHLPFEGILVLQPIRFGGGDLSNRFAITMGWPNDSKMGRQVCSRLEGDGSANADDGAARILGFSYFLDPTVQCSNNAMLRVVYVGKESDS